MRALPFAAVGSLVLLALGLGSVPAAAQLEEELGDTDWRQEGRTPRIDPDELAFDWEHFVFEIRFAPYWPEVDEELGGSEGPYERVFGTKARFCFGLELDWQPVRIPFVGTLGPAFGWSYTRAGGSGVLVSTGEPAALDTALTIMPMHFSAVLRGDYLLRRWSVPIVPYAKFGLGMGLWSASGGDETSEVDGVAGKGTSFGTHLALGGAFTVTALDSSSASAMNEAGLNHAHIFAEWMWANLDGIGSHPQMHVGTSTVAFGLAIDW